MELRAKCFQQLDFFTPRYAFQKHPGASSEWQMGNSSLGELIDMTADQTPTNTNTNTNTNTMKKALLTLLVTCGVFAFVAPAHADSVNLAWDASATAGVSYRVYHSAGADPFSVVAQTTFLSVTVSAITTTRFYVTAFNSDAESVPSNTITYVPALTGNVVLSVPALSPTTTTAAGVAIFASATIHNNTNQPLTIAEGAITARRPGASNAAGPYDNFSPAILPQTISAGATITVSGSFIVPASSPVGQWRAHISILDAAGRWLDGPDAFFAVIVAPPAPPANLRATTISASRIDLQWDAYALSSVFIERNQILVATVPNTQSFYLDTGVRRNRTYSYRIRGADTGYSNTATARTARH